MEASCIPITKRSVKLTELLHSRSDSLISTIGSHTICTQKKSATRALPILLQLDHNV